MGRTGERSLYDNIFGKFHRARLELHSSNWNPRSRVGARAATLAPALLRSRRPGVGFCYLATPRNEVGRGIVAINDAFDQRRPVIVGDRHFDGFLKFLAVSGAQAASMTILGIKSPDEPGIIPILDVVVGAVMDLDLLLAHDDRLVE